jgi:hypothetical protein
MSRSSIPDGRLPGVHVTDMNRFLKCRMYWAFASPLRLNLEPLVPSKHLLLGTWVHAALEAYYTGHRSYEDLDTAYTESVTQSLQDIVQIEGQAPEDILQYVDLGRGMLEHYALWAPHYDRFEVLAVEHEFEVAFPGFRYTGKGDLIVRDEAGDLWVMEHKTYTQVPSPMSLGLSLQPALYVYAARRDPSLTQHGRVKGVMYNVLHKKIPTSPEPLKSGGLSKRANIGCSPVWYRKCVADAGLEMAAYEDFIQTLDPMKLNTRHHIVLTDVRMAVAMQCFRRVAEEDRKSVV